MVAAVTRRLVDGEFVYVPKKTALLHGGIVMVDPGALDVLAEAKV